MCRAGLFLTDSQKIAPLWSVLGQLPALSWPCPAVFRSLLSVDSRGRPCWEAGQSAKRHGVSLLGQWIGKRRWTVNVRGETGHGQDEGLDRAGSGAPLVLPSPEVGWERGAGGGGA